MNIEIIKDELRVANLIFKNTKDPDVKSNIRNYRIKLKKILNGEVPVEKTEE